MHDKLYKIKLAVLCTWTLALHNAPPPQLHSSKKSATNIQSLHYVLFSLSSLEICEKNMAPVF